MGRWVCHALLSNEAATVKANSWDGDKVDPHHAPPIVRPYSGGGVPLPEIEVTTPLTFRGHLGAAVAVWEHSDAVTAFQFVL